ncbi:hypothetical protein SynBMKMC1_01132 [Synechococcus sp. BMK-MC-1]|nr:hypothetical protein SynBMKMC1_01132 [Synechococcus sp. BMK-MC-1]
MTFCWIQLTALPDLSVPGSAALAEHPAEVEASDEPDQHFSDDKQREWQ